MKIQFFDQGYDLANWCVKALEKNGITELPLLDTLMMGQRRLLLHKKGEEYDIEIYIEKTNIELLSKMPIYRFVVLSISSITLTRFSSEFLIEA